MTRLKLEITIVFILVVVILFVGFQWKGERKERIRTTANQTSLLSGIRHYKTKDSLNAVTIQELTLTKNELKAHESGLMKRIQDQGIKIKRLQSVTQIATETKIEFKTTIKDSLIFVPGTDSIIEMQCLEYVNPWIYFGGCFEADTLNGTILLPTKLEIIAHGIPKKIWFVKFGIKSINIEVISNNPYTDITYARNIKLQR